MAEADTQEWDGETLLQLREDEGLSYTELEERTGLPRSTMFNWIQDAREDGTSPEERAVKVYLPSRDTYERWEIEADDRNVPLSRFIQQAVEDYLRETETPDAQAEATALRERLDEVTQRLEQIRRERDRYDKLCTEYEDELEELRSQGTTPTGPSAREHLPEPVRDHLIKSGRLHRQTLPSLGFDLESREATRVIHQMQLLERLGVVESTSEGWSL